MNRALVRVTLLILFAISSNSYASEEGSIILLDVKEQFGLLALLESKDAVDIEVRENFELSFVRKLLLLRAASLDIEAIKGNELSGLCQLVTYSQKSKLKSASVKDAALTNLALDYVEAIESKVLNNVKQIQATIGGKGCGIGGS